MMQLNTAVDQVLEGTVRGENYPVTVAGKGMPCLAIGIGSLMQRTLSASFKERFKVYASDLYWVTESHPPLSLEQLVDDISELSQSLGIASFVLLAHSAYGLLALEFAKKHPSLLKGLILIGCPVNCNPEVEAKNQAYFDQHADPKRKEIDAARREGFANGDHSDLTPSERFLKGYIWRDAPRYWHDPEFDCTLLWEGVNLGGAFFHYFEHILPKLNVLKGLEKVVCPVFLAAGMSDYDCCPWDWKAVSLPKMTVSIFPKSGHYPNYEEPMLFDESVKTWARSL